MGWTFRSDGARRNRARTSAGDPIDKRHLKDRDVLDRTVTLKWALERYAATREDGCNCHTLVVFESWDQLWAAGKLPSATAVTYGYGETGADQSRPGQATPDHTEPNQTSVDQARPDLTIPVQTRPGHTRSGQTHQTRSGQTHQTRSGHTRSYRI